MQGHIHKRVRTSTSCKPITTWYVVIELGRSADGRRRQKWHGGFATRKEAQAVRAKLVNEVNTGIYAAPSKPTLAEWLADSWLPTMQSQIKASTWDSYDRLMRLHVIPALGSRPLHQLTPPLLNNLYAELMETGNRRGNTTQGLNAKTVRHVHTALHKALDDAVDAGLLSNNVAERAKPPKLRVAGRTETKAWSPEELAKFLVHVEGHRLQAAWQLAAMTGMRRGEVLGLRWEDVDLDAGRLAVRHTLVSVNYAVKDSTPKTHQARTIDLDGETVEKLRAHRERQLAEPSAWGPGYQTSDLVFRREDGSPVHPDLFSQAFEKLVRHSGFPRVRLQDLRHTHATIALCAGVPVKVISERAWGTRIPLSRWSSTPTSFPACKPRPRP